MDGLQNAGSQGKIMITSILLGIVIYGFVLLLLDGVYFFTSLKESYMGWTAAGALCIGCFFAGMKAGSGFGKRGLFWGLFAGAMVTALMAFSVKLTGGVESFSDLSVVKPGICIFFGGLGGMIGVNRK